MSSRPPGNSRGLATKRRILCDMDRWRMDDEKDDLQGGCVGTGVDIHTVLRSTLPVNHPFAIIGALLSASSSGAHATLSRTPSMHVTNDG